ncbi:MAG TPA: Ig-like domain-containing protein, partial [Marisediminicola sp.]|nr:Ig-like domain-containing protein [Marisediminicola sp.]
MLRRWLSRHKPLVATATSGSVIAALVATIAVVSGGYEAQRFDLGDGSVWVANGAQQAIGRANTQILQLDTVVEAAGTALDVVQSGATVLLVDRTENTVDVIDPATAESVESVPLPTQSPEVFLAGGTVVIHSARSGEVWIVPVADLGSFDAESEATRSLGAGSVVSVSPNGTIFLFSSDAREVYRVNSSTGDTERTYSADFGEEGADIGMTAIGERWVLLDGKAGRLSIEGRTVELAEWIPDPESALLGEPVQAGDRVIVSHEGGLLAVPLSNAEPERLIADRDGNPAPPLVLGNCVFGAWSSGSAWRQCGSSESVEFELAGAPAPAARLDFVHNGDHAVVNDPRSGATWAVQSHGESIDNWDDLIVDDEDQREVEEDIDDAPPEFEKNQLPPVAVDDEFGARAGRATLLPVLLNDYDPNGDALIVESVEQLDESLGRIDVVGDRQVLQLSLNAATTGMLTLRYTISDGRGGSASASVAVTVRSEGENAAPRQVRTSRAFVAQGGRASTSVLGDWIDPDGDAFYLTAASTPAPDSATYKPEGVVVFEEGGASGENRSVALVVSDGQADGVGSLEMTVHPVGEVPIIADPFVVPTYAGQEVTVSPLEHVRGGSGTIRLISVAPKAGASIHASLDSGTFRFVSEQVRSHNLDYVVSDGDQSVTGRIRVEVAPPPG